MQINMDSLAYPAVIWLSVTSLLVLISKKWRDTILLLALQYVGVFMLVALRWSVETSVAKLVAGWMASAVLAIAASESYQDAPGKWVEIEQTWPASRTFRILAASLVWLTLASLAPKTPGWLPGVGLPHAWGGLLLIGMGLLSLGLTVQPLRVICGLLTVLSGFEILYAAVESSALLTGLLAATHLGLALVGAYLLIAPSSREEVQ